MRSTRGSTAGIDASAYGTRCELLLAQRDQISGHLRTAYSLRHQVRAALAHVLALGFAFSAAITSAQLGRTQDPAGILGTSIVLAASAIGAIGLSIIASWETFSTAASRAELSQWACLDRTTPARALPRGDVPPGLATPFDADLAGFSSASSGAESDAFWQSAGSRIGPLVLIPTMGLGVALLMVFATVSGIVAVTTWAGILAGAWIGVPSAVALASVYREQRRAQLRLEWLRDDIGRLAAIHGLESGEPVDPSPSAWSPGRLVGLMVAGVAVVVLGARGGPTAAFAVAAVLCIAGMAGALRKGMQQFRMRHLVGQLSASAPGAEVFQGRWIDTQHRCDGSGLDAAAMLLHDQVVVLTTDGKHTWPLNEFLRPVALPSSGFGRADRVAFVRSDRTSVTLAMRGIRTWAT